MSNALQTAADLGYEASFVGIDPNPKNDPKLIELIAQNPTLESALVREWENMWFVGNMEDIYSTETTYYDEEYL